MSAPETNALSPAPTRITTRTSGLSRRSVSASPSPSHISSYMALRLAGLLKVMTPMPSVIAERILPSARDFSLALSSIGGGFRRSEFDSAGLKHSFDVSAMAVFLPRPRLRGEVGFYAKRKIRVRGYRSFNLHRLRG